MRFGFEMILMIQVFAIFVMAAMFVVVIYSWKAYNFWSDSELFIIKKQSTKPLLEWERQEVCDVRPGSKRETEGGEEWAASEGDGLPISWQPLFLSPPAL